MENDAPIRPGQDVGARGSNLTRHQVLMPTPRAKRDGHKKCESALWFYFFGLRRCTF